MILIRRATAADRAEIERLIAEYHASEHVVPKTEKIAWAVRQILRKRSVGILLVARERKSIRGVALGTFQPSAESGLTLTIHDFYVEPSFRRKGMGSALAKRLLEEARTMDIEHVEMGFLRAIREQELSGNRSGFAQVDGSCIPKNSNGDPFSLSQYH